MNLDFMSHQHIGHTEMGPQFKVSFERLEKLRIEPGTLGLGVLHLIHFTTAIHNSECTNVEWHYTSDWSFNREAVSC